MSVVEQKKNLLKLADWVEKNVSQKQFDMAFYRSEKIEEDSEEVEFTNLTDCGTHGCLLGWSPFVFPHKLDSWLLESSTYSGNRSIDWSDMEQDLYGDLDGFSWMFLFSSNWSKYDNTVEGAVKRIRHFCEGGEIAVPWEVLA